VSSRLEGVIAGLDTLDLDELRQEWTKRLKRPPPRCRSVRLVRGMLAWALQEEVYGGFSADTCRLLRELGNTVRRNGGSNTRMLRVMPGTVLTREWRGTLHKVVVLEHGFAYDGDTFEDLSSIARLITGARWSGPRFFGLRTPHPPA
jgi:hypothetical protein